MKILVSGCAGFIGSNLCEKLIAEGHSVVGIDNLSHGKLENMDSFRLNQRFDWYIDDVQDFRTGESFDVVVHLASEKIPRFSDAYDTIKTNQDMIEVMVDIARERGARLVFASTSDVYGKNSDVPFQEDHDLLLGNTTVKRWAYAVSKIHSEHYIQACNERFGLKYCIFRLFSAYGRRQAEGWWGGVQSAFIDNILLGKEIEIQGGGWQSRCFTYIDDAIDGIYRCITYKEAENEIFNIGNPLTGIAISYLANRLMTFTGNYVSINKIPVKAGKYEDSVNKIPDISKANAILEYSPTWGLYEGLKEMIKWRKSTIYGESSDSNSNV